MTQGNNKEQDLKRLERVLDIFGADPGRWPAAERSDLETLAGNNTDARRLLGEARALARVMDAAPVSQAGAALKLRIVAAAVDDAGREARIVPIQAARQRDAHPVSVRRAGVIWPAAALAASFALGLYMGVAGIGAAAVDGAFEIAASGLPDNDPNAIFWIDDGGAGNEEGPL